MELLTVPKAFVVRVLDYNELSFLTSQFDELLKQLSNNEYSPKPLEVPFGLSQENSIPYIQIRTYS